MSGALLALWIALIGADRIDLLGGHGPFTLTPFIALTPLVILSELARRGRRRTPVALSRDAIGYAAVGGALLAVIVTSTLLSDEVMVSGARSSLLIYQVTGTFVIALLASDRPDLARVLATGAALALPLFLYSGVMEVLWFLGHGPESVRFASATLTFNDIQTVGIIPRLSGPVGDGNRAGFVLIVYLVMLSRGIRGAAWRWAAVTVALILLITTISRSAALAGVATLAMAIVTRRHRMSARGLAVASLSVLAAVAVLLVFPRTLVPVENLAYSPLASRVSPAEGSAHSHVELLERGAEEGTESVRQSLIGIGYGNAYLVLQDIFPGNKYGNFHSLYATMFAEAGIVALLLVLVLMGVPLVRGGDWRPLVAGAVAFNLFYQSTAEPAFWFVLAMAWLCMPRVTPSVRAAVARERPRPSPAHS